MAERASTLKVEVLADASKLRAELDGISGKLQSFGQGVSRAGGTLTKFVSGPIAGAVGGLAMLAKKEGERADALLDAQARTQASLETLQEYEHVASQAGVAQDFFQSATKDMSRQLASAAQGGKRASAAFDKLNIDIRDANGEVRSTGELTEEAMQKLAGMTNESKRAAIAQDLFKSSQQDVLAVVSQGSEAIAKQRQEAHELGAVQSEEALEGANKFRQGLERLQSRFKGLLAEIGGKFAPLLSTRLLPLFEDKIAPALEGIADKIAGLVDWFTRLPGPVQGIIAAAAGLVAALGPVLLIVGKIVSVIGTLMPVLTAVAGAISLPVVAIAALAAGLVIAYRRSETFRRIVDQVFAKAKEVVSLYIDQIKTAIAAFVGFATAVWRRWGDDILAFARRSWSNIKQIVGGVLDVIRGIFDVFAGLFTADWDRMWSGVKQIASGVWDVITALADQFMNTIGRLISAGLSFLLREWRQRWNEAEDFVGGIVDAVVSFVGALPGRARDAIVGAWDVLSSWITRHFTGLKTAAINRAEEIIDWFADLPDKIIDAIGDLGGVVGGWLSDQLERLPFVGGGGPEVNVPTGAPAPGEGAMPPGGSTIGRLNAFMDSTGIAHRTTSTFRPGDDGFHGLGRAVDFAGRHPGRNTPNLRAIQQAFVPLAQAGVLKELIGPVAAWNYKDGRQFPYSAATQIVHDNHVHTAMGAGGIITEPIIGVGRSGATYELGERGPETVTPARGGDGAGLSDVVAELRRQNRLLARQVELLAAIATDDDTSPARRQEAVAMVRSS